MNFRDIQKFSIDTANLAFANAEEKEKIRKAILDTIVRSCLVYSLGKEFKDDVDGYGRRLLNQKSK